MYFHERSGLYVIMKLIPEAKRKDFMVQTITLLKQDSQTKLEYETGSISEEVYKSRMNEFAICNKKRKSNAELESMLGLTEETPRPTADDDNDESGED